ncbi:Inhibitor of apoptosis-promoting Bax1 [Bifidobacterium margollesii]|uniref:Inhibitor of apoptosis-promoting Bax1 n=1 Tax=Bifidobacterium margollesii TaxID=2020964 RepID=A0A2N5J8H7_9BIFI|nr:Bax inhibitor-1/YccA family protein [Bifidobacterium margollesii]PLS30495.1 Inhibitor of apoptosis-promoting Bax1 [Bifidobacterium margollesii]
MAFGFGRRSEGDNGEQYRNPQYQNSQYQNPQYQGQAYDGASYGQQQPYAQEGFAQAQSPYGPASYGQPVMDAQTTYVRESYERAKRVSTTKAYFEMTMGLLVTAVVAVLTQTTGMLNTYLQATGMIGWIVLALVQVGMAVFLGMRVMRMNPGTARVLFYVYAALMGFTLSTIFVTYSLGSIVMALGMSAAFFLCLTMFGLTTKIDMLKAGPILMVALLVLIVFEMIMMFFVPTGAMTMLISAIALLIFAGLTVHDAQFTRMMFAQYSHDDTMIRRVSILCALNLYLDFINFFVHLLTIFGSSND